MSEDVIQIEGVKREAEREWAGAWPRFEVAKEEELLTRVVQGQKASDLEERFYRAASQNPDIDWIRFQPSYGAGRNLPGEIRLDFLLSSGGVMYPVWLDGGYWHKTPEQSEKDKAQTARLDAILAGTNAYPGQRVPDTEVEDMEMAKQAVEKVLRGEYLE